MSERGTVSRLKVFFNTLGGKDNPLFIFGEGEEEKKNKIKTQAKEKKILTYLGWGPCGQARNSSPPFFNLPSLQANFFLHRNHFQDRSKSPF